MSVERVSPLDERSTRAVSELEAIITTHYPGATFDLRHGIDDPGSINILATVDVDDPDEVLDKVLDRVVELNVDDSIPVHVVALRTPERIAAARPVAGTQRVTPLRRLLPYLQR